MIALSTVGRVVALAAASVACALAATTAALVTLQLSLPPSDEAYGLPLTHFWSHPVVRSVALTIALGAGTLGFFAALWLLWGTRLRITVPIVFGVTVLAGGLAGPLSILGAVPALACGIAAMFCCRSCFPADRPRRPSRVIRLTNTGTGS